LLKDIFYILSPYLKAADKVFDILRESFPKLAKFPKIGRLRDELAPFLGSFSVKNYLIFSRPIDEGIEIVRILYSLGLTQELRNN
jgi:toxin ParE1/3/4